MKNCCELNIERMRADASDELSWYIYPKEQWKNTTTQTDSGRSTVESTVLFRTRSPHSPLYSLSSGEKSGESSGRAPIPSLFPHYTRDGSQQAVCVPNPAEESRTQPTMGLNASSIFAVGLNGTCYLHYYYYKLLVTSTM